MTWGHGFIGRLVSRVRPVKLKSVLLLADSEAVAHDDLLLPREDDNRRHSLIIVALNPKLLGHSSLAMTLQ